MYNTSNEHIAHLSNLQITAKTNKPFFQKNTIFLKKDFKKISGVSLIPRFSKNNSLRIVSGCIN